MKKNSKQLLDELDMPKPAGEQEADTDLEMLASEEAMAPEGSPEMENMEGLPEASALDVASLSDDELKEALKEAQVRGLSIDENEAPETMEEEQIDMDSAPAPKAPAPVLKKAIKA